MSLRNKYKEKKLLFGLYLCVILILLVSFYVQRATLFLPWHNDEWRHATLAQQFLDGDWSALFHMEAGFIIFVAFWLLLVPLSGYFIVTLTCIVLAGIGLWKLFDDKRISIVALCLYGALPSNAKLLGILYGVPMSLGVSLLILALVTLRARTVTWKYVLVLVATCFVHPPTAIVVGILGLIVYRSKRILAVGILFGAALLYVAHFKFGYTIQSLLFFGDTDINSISMFNIFFLCGIPLLIFSILAIYVIKFNKVAHAKSFIVLVWLALITSCNALLYIFFKFSILVPAERNYYLLMVATILLGSIGIIFAGVKLNTLLSKIRLRASFFVVVLCVLFIVGFCYYDNQFIEFKTVSQMVKQNEFDALSVLRAQPQAPVLSYELLNNVMYLGAGQRPLYLRVWEEGNRDAVLSYFNADTCAKKEEIIRSLGAEYVVNRKPETCSFLAELSTDGLFIYKVKDTALS
ncbi:MAG TPA: hypothetical protein VK158_04645 [Acidobacteriota bacterium]|nr:hypothetical protein [Acidobacteriota bacterium]